MSSLDVIFLLIVQYTYLYLGLMVKYVENKYDEDYNQTLGIPFLLIFPFFY